MVGPAVMNPSRHFRNLRTHDRGRKIIHPHVVKRQLVLPKVKPVLCDRMFFPIMFIGARHDDRPGNDIRIMGNQHSAFAGIHQLERLERKTADLAYCSDFPIGPQCAEGVRRILDHRNVPCVTKTHDRIHVGSMATHMADDHSLRPVRKFSFEIVQVDPVVLRDLDEDRLTAGMDDCGRHSGKRECRDKHFVTGRYIDRLQGQEQCGRAGIHRQSIGSAHELGELAFQLGDGRLRVRPVSK